MSINLSFFKKSAITGGALALVFSVGLAFFAHANAINNDQTSLHGTGYVAQLSTDPSKLVGVISPSTGPNVCSSTADNNQCKCPRLGTLCVKCPLTPANQICACHPPIGVDSGINSGLCVKCQPIAADHGCVWCPSNPKMMIACRIFPSDGDNDNDDQNAPAPTAAGAITTDPGTGSGSNNGDDPVPVDPSVQNDVINDNTNPQPSPTPAGATCPSDPRMGIACRAPGDPGTTNPCGYREVCTVQ